MKLINNLYVYPEQGGLDCNTYVIKGSPGVIIDPGSADFLPARVAGMKADGIEPKDIGVIVNTHLHIDHCGANDAFKKLSGARIGLHPVQQANYQLVVIDGARLFRIEPAEFTADYTLDSRLLTSGDITLELIPAQGHSPDCVCFYLRQEQVLVCGDVLFEMNTGRVDLPGGDGALLKKSIEALSLLQVEYLLPGHMSIVAGAASVAENFSYIRRNVFPYL